MKKTRSRKSRDTVPLMIEGSGSVPLTNGPGFESRRPKNIWIRRIRIRNTDSLDHRCKVGICVLDSHIRNKSKIEKMAASHEIWSTHRLIFLDKLKKDNMDQMPETKNLRVILLRKNAAEPDELQLNCLPEPQLDIMAAAPAPDPYYFIKFYRKVRLHQSTYEELKSNNVIIERFLIQLSLIKK
jgi:hypothetical protein